ncbi:hypothetical protein J5N97_001036 [Dioscorea zingiberensis]|uniref:RING-type domain-containing protein n=1 Tax=Dioscorea zingiberensis TaxID=325984 RepID=A0A9D5BUS1_9LILI|nr:hypothetical protein J5N97_001036 [Dioscorea zingiberensis]
MVIFNFHLAAIIIGLLLSTTFIVLICMRLSAVSPRELELRSELGRQPEHTIKGLESIKLATFPTMVYNMEALHSIEDIQCSICLGEYQQNEVLRTMPICGHYFHLVCIDSWLQKQSTCPICRLSLSDSYNAMCLVPPLYPLNHPNQ